MAAIPAAFMTTGEWIVVTVHTPEVQAVTEIIRIKPLVPIVEDVVTGDVGVGRVLASDSAKKGRGSFESDKPPVVTLVRRSDGRVEFPVRENLQDVDEEIADRGDETVILCTDEYTIYDDIDEYDGIDAHLAITHDETYVIGDAHVNSCENRHSFLRQ